MNWDVVGVEAAGNGGHDCADNEHLDFEPCRIDAHGRGRDLAAVDRHEGPAHPGMNHMRMKMSMRMVMAQTR